MTTAYMLHLNLDALGDQKNSMNIQHEDLKLCATNLVTMLSEGHIKSASATVTATAFAKHVSCHFRIGAR